MLRRQTFGSRLYDLDEYWTSLRSKARFFAVVTYLEHERWLDEPITPNARSRGESWIVLATPELEASWLGQHPLPPRQQAPRQSKPSRPRRTITPALRFEVFRRDSFTCQYCGRRAPRVVLHVDHIIPVAAGGTNDPRNLRTACSLCNLGKGSRSLVGCQ